MNINFTEFFVIFIMTVMLLIYLSRHYGEVEYVRSSKDNREYLVNNLSDKQMAANLLAEVTADLQTLVHHTMAKFPTNPDIIRLYNNFNPDSISEGSPDSGMTSFTSNKGERLILCVRHTDKTFIDKNTINYVAIHELGHMMTAQIGHTTEFWENFKFLLNEAISINLYRKVDYAKDPQKYCGIQINSSVV